MDIANRKSIPIDLSCFDRRNMESAFQIFGVIHNLLKDLDDIRQVSREVLEDFKNQNVAYLELRTTPKACEFGRYSQRDYINTILEEMDNFN